MFSTLFVSRTEKLAEKNEPDAAGAGADFEPVDRHPAGSAGSAGLASPASSDDDAVLVTVNRADSPPPPRTRDPLLALAATTSASTGAKAAPSRVDGAAATDRLLAALDAATRACRHGDEAALAALRDVGTPIGPTQLLAAVEAGHFEIARTLIDECDVPATRPVLAAALAHVEFDAFAFVVARVRGRGGAGSEHVRDFFAWPGSLRAAVAARNADAVECILEFRRDGRAGVDGALFDAAVRDAVRVESPECVDALFAGQPHRTPTRSHLCAAAMTRSADVVGAVVGPPERRTPRFADVAYAAVRAGSVDVLRLLVELGFPLGRSAPAPTRRCGSRGKPAPCPSGCGAEIALCCRRNDAAMLAFLLELGCGTDASRARGLVYASERGCAAAAAVLAPFVDGAGVRAALDAVGRSPRVSRAGTTAALEGEIARRGFAEHVLGKRRAAPTDDGRSCDEAVCADETESLASSRSEVDVK